MSAQIEATLQLPCLSRVPLLRDPEQKLSPRATVQVDKEFGQRTLSRSSGMYWAATAMPLSRFAESIRSIKLAIDLNPTNTSNKIVGITSALVRARYLAKHVTLNLALRSSDDAG
jgi:hypothetical protein